MSGTADRRFATGDRVVVLPPGEIPDLPGICAAYFTGTVINTFSDGSYIVVLDDVPPGLPSGGREWRFLSDQLAPVVEGRGWLTIPDQLTPVRIVEDGDQE